MRRPKAVIAAGIYPAAQALIETVAEAVLCNAGEPRATLLAHLADADALFCASNVPVDADLIAHAPKLRIIASASVGTDNIDLGAARKRGISVTNTPGVLVEATADLVWGLTLALMRKIVVGQQWIRDGKWTSISAIPYGTDLEEKRLGIVGLGAIGSAVARRAKASRMHVSYHNRKPRSDDAIIGAWYSGFDELLEHADCVIALVPLTAETRRRFDAAAFSKMKPTAFFINGARGGIVDTDALLAALRDGTIAGAALDVTDPEPLAADHPLLHLENCIVTPHIGSATHETRERMSLLAARNLIAALRGDRLETPV